MYLQLRHEFVALWHFCLRVFSYFYRKYPREFGARVFSTSHPAILFYAKRTCTRDKKIELLIKNKNKISIIKNKMKATIYY